ncbi:hypothetical protein B0H66DRAFT_203725 [Apodospora peruviana]|uniref:Uncharacterized protein n=1 Tax=Apodospora peruviana TaxID=516989 RepID=A0AAE0ICF0_9PEZI|nr:hypothetical protein B0H66DRAFT_203725 [Apodospora peruviana]
MAAFDGRSADIYLGFVSCFILLCWADAVTNIEKYANADCPRGRSTVEGGQTVLVLNRWSDDIHQILHALINEPGAPVPAF